MTRCDYKTTEGDCTHPDPNRNCTSCEPGEFQDTPDDDALAHMDNLCYDPASFRSLKVCKIEDVMDDTCGCNPICYQCEKPVKYLFDDGRCKDCTRMTPDEIQGK